MRLSFCRDKTLAGETILYIRMFGREFYAWVEGSPAIGYRFHMSRYLAKDWWLLSRRGSYSRSTYRRLPSESWKSRSPEE
jgi:hypothetical protein